MPQIGFEHFLRDTVWKMSFTKHQSLTSSLYGVLFAMVWLQPLNAVILPTEVCTVSSATFRMAGCIGKGDAFCKLLAFQLIYKFDNEPLCIERPCSGFGLDDTHECKGLLDCPLPRVFLPGICNGLDICCRKSDVDPSVDASLLDQVDDLFRQGTPEITGKTG
ncbi:hypothetical protein RRG08_038755 [Elysia crispata]|uniref:Uncharacterized protein n=1 Tax=Elysia crispata TaxID=231223 RepID=A0AAE1ALV3_9GAST|nr:hypothetical protein RRG08_038755 [Elysia crispata]